MLFGMPFALVGLILFIPIFTVPVGILIMAIGAYPFAKLHSISVYWYIQQERAHTEYDDEGNMAVRPWEGGTLVTPLPPGDLTIL
jgi:hypothetical protein